MLAAVHLRFLVPRMPLPELQPQEEPPDYQGLATWRQVGFVALLGFVGALALCRIPVVAWAPWVGYLGGGAALIYVDLRTCYLPRLLTLLVAAQLGLGLAVLACFDVGAAALGLLGSLLGFGFFRIAWALSASLGYGDVRLASLVGAVAGTQGLPTLGVAILLGTLIGAGWAIVAGLRGGHSATFPYGPALWLGPIVAVWVSG